MIKKTLSFLCALGMAFSMLCSPVFAGEQPKSEAEEQRQSGRVWYPESGGWEANYSYVEKFSSAALLPIAPPDNLMDADQLRAFAFKALRLRLDPESIQMKYKRITGFRGMLYTDEKNVKPGTYSYCWFTTNWNGSSFIVNYQYAVEVKAGKDPNAKPVPGDKDKDDNKKPAPSEKDRPDNNKPAKKRIRISRITAVAPAVTLTKKGDKAVLKAKIQPGNASSKKLQWTSSNSRVKVDKNGKVTAMANSGKAVITAKATDGSKKTVKYTVYIGRKVTSVKLNRSSMKMRVKQKAVLKGSVLPANAANKKVIWTSNNPKVVKVDSKGRLVAVSIGKAVITAKSQDCNKKRICRVTVI